MNSYKFGQPPDRPTFGPLPDDDYPFSVVQCDSPYFKNEHWILSAKLAIRQGLRTIGTVYANPWSGTDKNGDERDGIAEFLLAIGRAPAPGEEPDWKSVLGATGRCRLKTEVAKQGSLAGKEVNKVAWFILPTEAPGASLGKLSPKKDEPPDDLNMEPEKDPF